MPGWREPRTLMFRCRPPPWSPPKPWATRHEDRILKQWFRRPGVQAALAWLMAAYLRFALSTIRWRQENRACAEAVWDAPQPGRGGVVVCFWHSRIALSPACWPLERAQASVNWVNRPGRIENRLPRRWLFGDVPCAIEAF